MASTNSGLVSASGFKFTNSDEKKSRKLKLKKIPATQDADTAKDEGVSSGSESPILPEMDEETMVNFPSGKPREEQLETVICKHCKRPVLRRTAKEHIVGCLKSKQDKAKKKREAREAAARAKERADQGNKDEEDEDDDDIIPTGSRAGGARKSTAAGAEDGTKKGKKRKVDADEDKEPKKKKKKEEPKPKAVKPKGPVDVERQCGVILPNGAQCARSLTCKSHSMGAKRAVPGRSLPYDMLLQAYQKKNQARQQKAAIDANAPLLFDDDLDPTLAGPINSDEERDAVMNAISRGLSRPQPLATHYLFPTRKKYQLVRMKEMLSNALSGSRGGSMFSVPPDAARTTYPGSALTDNFAIPSAITPSSASNGSVPVVKGGSRKPSVDNPSQSRPVIAASR